MPVCIVHTSKILKPAFIVLRPYISQAVNLRPSSAAFHFSGHFSADEDETNRTPAVAADSVKAPIPEGSAPRP